MGADLTGESAFRSGLWIGMRSDESNEQAGPRGAGAGLWPQPLVLSSSLWPNMNAIPERPPR